MLALERESRKLVIKQCRLPIYKTVTTFAIGNSPYIELIAMIFVMTTAAFMAYPREKLPQSGLFPNKMTARASLLSVPPFQGPAGFFMIKRYDVPGFL